MQLKIDSRFLATNMIALSWAMTLASSGQLSFRVKKANASDIKNNDKI